MMDLSSLSLPCCCFNSFLLLFVLLFTPSITTTPLSYPLLSSYPFSSSYPSFFSSPPLTLLLFTPFYPSFSSSPPLTLLPPLLPLLPLFLPVVGPEASAEEFRGGQRLQSHPRNENEVRPPVYVFTCVPAALSSHYYSYYYRLTFNISLLSLYPLLSPSPYFPSPSPHLTSLLHLLPSFSPFSPPSLSLSLPFPPISSLSLSFCRVMTDGMKYCLATGNWGDRKNPSKAGVVQVRASCPYVTCDNDIRLDAVYRLTL